ncbi:MAG: cytochrome c biogenesis protein ResB [Desulfobacterales bacterium]|nr:cytochrome c biogenesis protein ResB [Desulfobacterales bacterium]
MKEKERLTDQIWMFFASVKLSVYTLVLLALTSIIGTVVLQNGSPQQYVNLYGEGMYNLIRVLGVDDMYHAWWFLALLVLLCVNIVVCSVERLSTTWKIIFPKEVRFNPSRFRKSKTQESFEARGDVAKLEKDYLSFLKGRAKHVIRKEEEGAVLLYGERGRWTRLGVYVVHASVLLLLVGALIGSLFGFKANLRLDEGDKKGVVKALKTKLPIKLPFVIQCNDFEVRFYDTGAPEEFRSNLTIIENGKESFSEDIRVNHPLRYKGINIYQSSYGMTSPAKATFTLVNNSTGEEVSASVRKGGSTPLPGGQGVFKFEGFLPHFDFRGHNLGSTFIGRIVPEQGEGVQVALPVKFPTFDKMRKGDFTVKVKDFEEAYYTGLQVTKDPGVWYVYAGFVLMIIGCWITFFMAHETYFIQIQSKGDGEGSVLVAAGTNRNSQSMKLKLNKLVTQLKEI